ncbi:MULTISPECIES: sensor domain-containing diguanylate cyclase [unclassified Aeromicrobium]|uniref:sensor domain-containing diguanylate cyclase n=1 Tax=unclassified Aeromicrobium TaxID=2633570 RepID=UPI000A697432|nr:MULTISPECIES: sensor domain-containing diguanylate cyclase [unclassified Aeromicrobium]
MEPLSPATGTDTFSAVANRVVEYLRRSTPISDWSVNRRIEGEQVFLHTTNGTLVRVGDRRPWDQSYCHRAFDLGADAIVDDVTTHPQYSDLRIGATRSYAGVPIRDPEGEMFGMLCGLGVDPLDGADVDAELLAVLGDLLGAHLSLARRAESDDRERRTAEALAQTDALTGLVNRRGWDSVLADAGVRASAYGDLAAVVLCDLDGLKDVNDRDGHAAGDTLLQRTAHALTRARGAHDTLARYGGDEFVVLVEDVSPRLLSRTLQRYRDALEHEGVEASFGWSLVFPGDEPVDLAFQRADRSMYEDKRARRAARREPDTAAG